jgi:serine O-acetyltransferase
MVRAVPIDRNHDPRQGGKRTLRRRYRLVGTGQELRAGNRDMKPTAGISLLDAIRRDHVRHEHGWADPGVWILAVYRFGMWASARPHRWSRKPLWWLYRLARLPLLPFGVHLWAGPRGARIAPGLVLIHPNNVRIGSGAEIGENCLIFHDVTIGTGPVPGVPKIGRNVDIYVGARVLGGITIGDGTMIGANSVVTRDVPPGSVVMAPPCKVLPRALSPYASAADQRATQPTVELPSIQVEA